MIHDLSRTLEALLDDPALGPDFPELLAAHVVFDRPDENFAPQAPASLNLFLYDIRENTELRDNQPIVERINGQARIQLPPRRIDCSYLVTAWPVGPIPLSFREHQLLGQALQVLGRHPKIPAPFLQGLLIGQAPPLPMMAPPADGLKSPADFWTAMGNQLRAAFTVTATISIPQFPPTTAPVVATVESELGFTGAPGEERFRIAGRVLQQGTVNPIADARVLVVETNQEVDSNAQGQFDFGLLPAGNYTLEVTHTAFTNQSKAIVVPGTLPSDFDVELAP